MGRFPEMSLLQHQCAEGCVLESSHSAAFARSMCASHCVQCPGGHPGELPFTDPPVWLRWFFSLKIKSFLPFLLNKDNSPLLFDKRSSLLAGGFALGTKSCAFETHTCPAV